MIEPFEKAEVPGLGPEGHYVPVANADAEWFFDEPAVATREYNGHLMRQTVRGWEYHRPGLAKFDGWHAVYPKVNYFRQTLQVLANRWRIRNSPYVFVEEFEAALSPFTDEYPRGEYWLVPGEPEQPWTLVPVNLAEQLSNINELDLHKLPDVETTFNVLKKAVYTLKDNIYGIIFTAADGKRVHVKPDNFDWTEYADA